MGMINKNEYSLIIEDNFATHRSNRILKVNDDW